MTQTGGCEHLPSCGAAGSQEIEASYMIRTDLRPVRMIFSAARRKGSHRSTKKSATGGMALLRKTNNNEGTLTAYPIASCPTSPKYPLLTGKYGCCRCPLCTGIRRCSASASATGDGERMRRWWVKASSVYGSGDPVDSTDVRK